MKAIHLLLDIATNAKRKRLLCQALNGLKTKTMRNLLIWISLMKKIQRVGRSKVYYRRKLRKD
jgi:hypothetical protein